MPSSPRPPNSDSTTPILVRTADTTSDAELLSLIENARSAVARARDATEQYAPRRTTTTLEELADDPAASSLLERHTRRRDMELEWDERDTDRRARELIARLENDPPPNHLVDLDDDDSEDEVMVLGETGAQGDRWDYSGPTLGRRPLTAAQLERYGLSPYGGTLRESEEDDDEFYEPETAIFGFDGDVTDEDEEDELDMSNDEVSTAPRPSSIWPGLLGERPLNPSSPETLLDENRNLPKAKAPYGNDPSSSTSFTSFLSPGATFKGQQVTSGRPTSRRTAPRPAQIVQARARRSVGSAERARSGVSEGDPASTAHPSFAPVSSSTPSLPGTVRDQQASSVFNSTADPTQAFLLGPLRPTSSTSSSTSHPNVSSTELAASNRTSSSRYAPYSSHTPVGYPSTTSAATIPSAPIPPNLSPVERARLSIARSHNPGARSNPASWREVADELLVSLRTDDESAAAERAAAIASGREEERWEVQVVVHSYDPGAASLTGLMSAYGIQSSLRDLSTHPTRVTTYFSASIIQPLVDGLFVSPSPTGSGGSSLEGIKVSQSTEAESWIQVGPFKGMTKNDLLRFAKDRSWVEKEATGWVLMRWKERDFVNVKANESSLSINGFYFVALNRATGVIEGLYSDPASSPYQRLDLSPSTPSGMFSLGSYSMC